MSEVREGVQCGQAAPRGQNLRLPLRPGHMFFIPFLKSSEVDDDCGYVAEESKTQRSQETCPRSHRKRRKVLEGNKELKQK